MPASLSKVQRRRTQYKDRGFTHSTVILSQITLKIQKHGRKDSNRTSIGPDLQTKTTQRRTSRRRQSPSIPSGKEARRETGKIVVLPQHRKRSLGELQGVRTDRGRKKPRLHGEQPRRLELKRKRQQSATSPEPQGRRQRREIFCNTGIVKTPIKYNREERLQVRFQEQPPAPMILKKCKETNLKLEQMNNTSKWRYFCFVNKKTNQMMWVNQNWYCMALNRSRAKQGEEQSSIRVSSLPFRKQVAIPPERDKKRHLDDYRLRNTVNTDESEKNMGSSYAQPTKEATQRDDVVVNVLDNLAGGDNQTYPDPDKGNGSLAQIQSQTAKEAINNRKLRVCGCKVGTSGTSSLEIGLRVPMRIAGVEEERQAIRTKMQPSDELSPHIGGEKIVVAQLSPSPRRSLVPSPPPLTGWSFEEPLYSHLKTGFDKMSLQWAPSELRYEFAWISYNDKDNVEEQDNLVKIGPSQSSPFQ